MSWSFRIARLFGVDVKVHFTFVLLLGIQVIAGYQEAGPAGLLTAFQTLLVFGCVVLHEFGHILTARRFGIQTRDVVLLPIGGVARLERLPERPREELLIAVAGPAVNLVLAVLLGVYLAARGVSVLGFLGSAIPAALFGNAGGADPLMTGPLARFLLLINTLLLGFNLLPAYPMDGGRVFRALLTTRLGYVRATRIAATVGQGLAMVAGLYGLLSGNYLFMLLALFVFLAAGQEAAMVVARAAGRGIIVDQMMITRYTSIPLYATLRQAVDLLLEGEQREFPVLDTTGAIRGLLTRDNLIRGLAARGADSAVSDAMTQPVPTLPLGLSFEEALGRLRASGLPALPVVDGTGHLVGLLTMDNITDLILVRQAVARA
jgi:stage IV sporulation protein FB